MLDLTWFNSVALRLVFYLAPVALVTASCALTAERYAPFRGQVLLIDTLSPTERSDTSLTVDTLALNLLDISGTLIYDREFDGELDDTIPLLGDEEGSFSGVLHYLAPPNINVPHMPRPVQISFPELGLDTFLTVEAYQTGSQGEAMTDWGPLFVYPPVRSPVTSTVASPAKPQESPEGR